MLSLKSIRPPKKIFEKLMNEARVTDQDKIALRIHGEVELTLEPQNVFLVFGVGMKGGKIKDLPKENDQCSNINEQMFRLLKYAHEKSVNTGAGLGQDMEKDHEAMPSLEDATLSQNKDDIGPSQNKDDTGLGVDQDKGSEVMPTVVPVQGGKKDGTAVPVLSQEDARNTDDTVVPVQGGKKDGTVVPVQGKSKKSRRDY